MEAKKLLILGVLAALAISGVAVYLLFSPAPGTLEEPVTEEEVTAEDVDELLKDLEDLENIESEIGIDEISEMDLNIDF
jgi:hypothetical protein